MGKIMLNGVDYSAAVTSGAIDAETRDYYTIVGVDAKATGLYSTAVGAYTNAKSNNATALGSYSVALGGYCTAVGSNANANGYGVTTLGYNANAGENYSMALGYNANALVNNCTAVGSNAKAASIYSTALGYSARANGYSSIALGHTARTLGGYSTALGYNANVVSNYSTALGYSAITSNANSIQLGNASFLSSITSKVAITVTSDERDKADITKIEDGALAFLSKVVPIRYVFNGRELYIDEDNLTDEERNKKAKYGLCAYDKTEHGSGTKKGSRIRVGVSAQNVQQALEAIYGNDSYANLVNNNLFDFDLNEIPEGVESQLAVNYEGFIPFLIKAVQELAAKVERLQGKGDA